MKLSFQKLGIAFLIAFVFIWIMWPAIEKKINYAKRKEARKEITMLFEILQKYAEQTGKFPENLEQVANSYKSVIVESKTGNGLEGYLYCQPDEAAFRINNYDKTILAEKPGHYFFSDGGFIVFLNGTVSWVDKKTLDYYVDKMHPRANQGTQGAKHE